MKKFVEPKMEVVELDCADVLCTSGGKEYCEEVCNVHCLVVHFIEGGTAICEQVGH